jgi:tRNA A37 threonylcarbamoyladenosine dehydratase
MAQLRLGLIGLGALGSRIATRLLRTGFSLEIYDIADVAVRMFNMDVGGIVTGWPKMMVQSATSSSPCCRQRPRCVRSPSDGRVFRAALSEAAC